MFRKILFAVSFGLALGAEASAQGPSSRDPLAGSPVYSDPGFQEFVETTYGYLNPNNKDRAVTTYRDAVASPAPAPRKAARARSGKYVFVSILPKARDYSGLVEELSASAGFVFSGERTVHLKSVKKTRIVGWVLASRFSSVRNNPGVAGVRLVKKSGARTL